jgi:glycosyltransferase EpsD
VAANSDDGTDASANGQDRGAEVIPCCDHKFNIDIQRRPLDRRNVGAYGQIKRILAETRFDIVHCHTPMGSVLGRLAAKKYRKAGVKVLYTAHGFHFYKGAPKSAWLVYYPVEKFLSRCTDGLITINKEDYELAGRKLRARQTFFTHGAGYDAEKFFPRAPEEKDQLRASLGYGKDDLLLIYVAELNHNKNQGMLLRVLKRILDSTCPKRERTRLLLVGPDSLDGEYQRSAKELGVSDSVDFLGYRDDTDRLIPLCDIIVASSRREGLPINVAEAMACGLPAVATDIRGHRDLIEDGRTGFLVGFDDSAMAGRVMELFDGNTARKIGTAASASVEQFSSTSLAAEMASVYLNYAPDGPER